MTKLTMKVSTVKEIKNLTSVELNAILGAKYKFRDCSAKNLRGYFHKLLRTLWDEGEGFSGKRPFGNSDWDMDVCIALVSIGALAGTVDYDIDGYLMDHDYDQTLAFKLVFRLIDFIFTGE